MLIALRTTSPKKLTRKKSLEAKLDLASTSAAYYKYRDAHIDFEDIENGMFVAIAATINLLGKAADNHPNEGGYIMPPSTERSWKAFVRWVEQGKHLEQELMKAYLIENK